MNRLNRPEKLFPRIGLLKIKLHPRLQLRNVILYCQPKLLGFDFIVTVHQNMAHAFDYIPFNFRMRRAEFLGQHINRLSDDLHMFHETKKHDGIFLNLLQRVMPLAFQYHANGVKNMPEPVLIPYLLSHKSISCRGWHSPRQTGANSPPQ